MVTGAVNLQLGTISGTPQRVRRNRHDGGIIGSSQERYEKVDSRCLERATRSSDCFSMCVSKLSIPARRLIGVASSATQTLLSLPEYKAARRISVYLSMPTGEISTLGIVRDALAQGKKVFIPYTYNLATPNEGQPKSIMDMVELQSTQDLDTLQPDNWGIPTPSEESISSRTNSFGGIGITEGAVLEKAGSGLDLIVMPGMVFDSQFGRLGHGKGFYDYFLTRCHQAAHVPFRGKNYW